MADVVRTHQRVDLPDALLVQLFREVPAVLWSTDRDLRFTWFFAGGLVGLNDRPDQLIGKTLPESFETEDADGPAIAAHRRALGGESVCYEQQWAGRTCEAHVAPLRDDEGRIIGCGGFAQDVTERRRAEEAIGRSRGFLQAVIDAIPEVTMVIDRRYRVVLTNRAAREMAGGKDPAFEGLTCYRASHRYDVPCEGITDPCPMAQVVATKAPMMVTHTHYDADGNEVLVEVSAAPIFDEAGEVVQVIEACRDITDRKRAEREQQRLVHDLGERVKELACMYGTARSVRDRQILQEVFRDVTALIPQAWRYPEITRAKIVFDGQEHVSEPFEETQWKQSSEIIVDGEPRGVVEVYYLERRPQLDEGPFLREECHLIDALARALGGAVEHKRAEEERNKLIAELEAKNAELERFTYTVSHDLKSPLITIQGFLGLLERDAVGGKVERMEADVGRIREAAGRMHALLDDLLGLSRIGRLIGPPEEISLRRLAHEAVDLLAGPIAERGVQVEISPELPTVYADRCRLAEALQNLVENAVKFTGDQPQPRVEIGVRKEPDEAGETVFYVRDNGLGIDPRYQHRVFGLFDKLDQQSDGTGVGLALVKRIVEIHGGRVWVESEGRGQGCTFCFTLPRKGSPAGEIRHGGTGGHGEEGRGMKDEGWRIKDEG